MASVYKNGGKGKWYASWIDENGNRRTKSTRTTDKATAERIAAKLENDAAKRRDGLSDPRDERFAAEAKKAIDSHLADFATALAAEGNDSEYVKQRKARVAAIIAACNAKHAGDLTAFAVQKAIDGLRVTGKSHATCNAYIRSIKGFTSWLCRDKRLRDDPLSPIQQFNEATDRRRVRRELSPDELVRLIETTERRTRKEHKISGPDRAMLYRLAVGTGFRASELRSLKPESFDLDSDPPTVTVAAAYSKRGRDDVQPIRLDLAKQLRDWLVDKVAGRRVFANMPGDTARMLRADLDAARVEWINVTKDDAKERQRREKSDFLKYVNTAGAVFDFHAFRHTYVSTLVNSGVSVKVAQELARHSTPTLTIGLYAHVRLHDLRGALDALPQSAEGSVGQPVAMRATGTNGHSEQKPVTAHFENERREIGNLGAAACEQPDGGCVLNAAERSRRKSLKHNEDASPCDAVRVAGKIRNECYSEGKRMVSGHTGNVVPRKGLRVRVPCPPLF
jgi:integrase